CPRVLGCREDDPSGQGQQGRKDARLVLVFRDPDNEGDAVLRQIRLQRRGECPRACRVVGAVHDDQRRASNHLETAGPPRVVETATYGRLVRSEGARGGRREERVTRLEHAQHPAPGILDPPVRPLQTPPLPLPPALPPPP